MRQIGRSIAPAGQHGSALERMPVRLSRWQRLSERIARRGHGVTLTVLVWLVAIGAGIGYGGHGMSFLNLVGRAAGLHVRYIQVTGQNETSDSAIVAALGLDPSSSLLAVDADAARERLVALPWITAAEVRTYLPGVIEISITETAAFARWDDGSGNGRRLIDRTGRVLADWVEPRFAELPLVVGKDANLRAAEGIDRLAAHPQIRQRLVAAVLVSGRRWDLVLEGGVKVQLPAETAPDALAALSVLQGSYDILDRSVALIDLRLADRTTVQLSDGAAAGEGGERAVVRAATRGRAI